MYLLRVSYRVRAHDVPRFEKVFAGEILPLAREHGLRLRGFWKTWVGAVGEYMELWEFRSMEEYETRWKRFFFDPRLKAVFEVTGPLVEGEESSLLEPVELSEPPPPDRHRV